MGNQNKSAIVVDAYESGFSDFNPVPLSSNNQKREKLNGV